MGGLSFYARRYNSDYGGNYFYDSEPKLFSFGLCTYTPWPPLNEYTDAVVDPSQLKYTDPEDNNIFYAIKYDNITANRIRFCLTNNPNDNYIEFLNWDSVSVNDYAIFKYNGNTYQAFDCSGWRNYKRAVMSSFDITATTMTGCVRYDNNEDKYILYGGYSFPSYPTQAKAEEAAQALRNLLNMAPGPSPIPPDPYNDGGNTDTGGGDGNFDNTSDPVDIPSLPTLTVSNTGFITLFNPSTADLQNLAAYMWSNLFDLNGWKKIFADPMNAILGLSIVPVNIPTSGSAAVTVGNISTGITMPLITSQYVTVDCGSITVSEYWGAYLDYAPYTKAEMYLPYCGIHAIDIDDIMGKTVNIVYHVDVLSGACCVYIKSGNSILYTFIGQCSSSIPITGDNWTNVVNGVLSAAVSIGSMAATNGVTAGKELPKLASNAINNTKPAISKSGAMGGTGGMLAYQKPYLIITRPRQALPVDQNKFIGYPSYITVNLSDLSGYTEIESIHLVGVNATENELKEIEQILMNGVIF